MYITKKIYRPPAQPSTGHFSSNAHLPLGGPQTPSTGYYSGHPSGVPPSQQRIMARPGFSGMDNSYSMQGQYPPRPSSQGHMMQHPRQPHQQRMQGYGTRYPNQHPMHSYSSSYYPPSNSATDPRHPVYSNVPPSGNNYSQHSNRSTPSQDEPKKKSVSIDIYFLNVYIRIISINLIIISNLKIGN